jgi:hypothetical protein
MVRLYPFFKWKWYMDDGASCPFVAEAVRGEARGFNGTRLQDDAMNKQECLARFDYVKFWHSRTRELIASSETYDYPAFAESFRQLRRESRKAEFLLVVALYQFEQDIEEQASDGSKESR